MLTFAYVQRAWTRNDSRELESPSILKACQIYDSVVDKMLPIYSTVTTIFISAQETDYEDILSLCLIS